MNIKEAADFFKVSEKTIRRWIKAGKIKAELISGKKGPEYRIDENSLSDFKKEKPKSSKAQVKTATSSKTSETKEKEKTDQEIWKKLYQELLQRHEQAMILMGKLQGELNSKVPLLEERAASLSKALEEKEKIIIELRKEIEILKNPPEEPEDNKEKKPSLWRRFINWLWE